MINVSTVYKCLMKEQSKTQQKLSNKFNKLDKLVILFFSYLQVTSGQTSLLTSLYQLLVN